jgi:N-formylglutamate deformylase
VNLPLLISVPHAGLSTPPEVADINLLAPQQIAEDGDEGAAEIYAIGGEVGAYVTTDIARAFVDQNRAQDDRRADGVVKTHTCWNVPIYHEPLSELIVQQLLERYYRPYHKQLSERSADAVLGLDCHTMAAVGPPIGPDAGVERPPVCLSNGDGTCSEETMRALVEAFEHAFELPVSVNDPFRGGFIVRSHAHELPWVQVELSRAAFMSNAEKRERFLRALAAFLRDGTA